MTELYPCGLTFEASPKAISRRTSYLRVRLAFHPLPQVIPASCTRVGSGLHEVLPSLHPAHGKLTRFRVKCVRHIRPLRLAFASAPGITPLTKPHTTYSLTRSTKSTPSPQRAPTLISARNFRFFFTPLPGFFSPFPHGTCSLSISKSL